MIFGRSSRAILNTLFITFAASFGLCVWLTFRSQPWAFFMVPTRAWEFAVGGIIACIVASASFRLSPRTNGAIGWVGLVALGVSACIFSSTTVFPGYWAALPVLGTALIILGGTGRLQPRWTASSLLSTRPLVFVGKVSYSMYLVHWPLLVIPQIVISERHIIPLWAAMSLAALSVPLAWIIFELAENPARNWRVLSTRPPRITLFVAAVLTLCLTAVAIVSLEKSSTVDLFVDALAPATTILPLPTGTAIVPRNLVPSLNDASSDNPTIYRSGCHLSVSEIDPTGCTAGDADAPISVALFGDSHAAQWYPALEALARQGRIVLTSHTKSSCPSFDIPDRLLATAPYPECTRWRADVTAALENTPPDIVLLANFIDAISAEYGDADKIWATGIGRAVERLSAASTILVLADTRNFEISPSVCLSAHLANAAACGVPMGIAHPPGTSRAARSATEQAGGRFADLTEYLCSAILCPVVIGNTLVYRDSHHLSASFSTLLADALGSRIERSIPGSTG